MSKMTKKIISEIPINISEIDNFENFKKIYNRDQKISFNCSICNSPSNRRLRFISFPLYCQKCQIIQTSKERYGSFEEMQKRNLAHGKQTRKEKYGDENYNNPKKREKTNIEKYGVKNYTNREKANKTIKERYNVNNISELESVKEKRSKTKKEKYGYENYNNQEKLKETCLLKYGTTNPGFLKSRYIFDNLNFDSSWELYYYIYCKLHNYDISRNNTVYYSYEYEGKVHKYYPDFIVDKKFYEIKGDQFFENGKMICPYDRNLDNLYEAKHQCMIKNNVTILLQKDLDIITKEVDNIYTNDFVPLFKIGLPFPYINQNFTDKSDMGIIHYFHKSIYIASRKNKLSPITAWGNKDLIKKCAENRLKYIGHCRPSDILQGFNVTKIAPKISVFKPSLAEKIILSYCTTKNVFDPFSGFSGRLIGAANLKKTYIGQDINELHIKESKDIIQYKNWSNLCSVKVQNIITDSKKVFENTTLFTCPPYGGKEHWNENNDEIEKSCDEWIDLCLEKYKCDKYIFVVDKTEKYKNCIVEVLENKSHFGKNYEYLIVIT